ncbi:MAG TPA: hypothetical protein DCP89_02490 [Acidimicrobiaceae bacterium]|jgi:hypothetical protein|nr:hypothetical protein [Actinomycetota bacterium]NCG41904.1 hypothetical protein [Actinomycetota bacterium]HAN07348.1 hypothetical protein [Acidimicrobiaceae bacterium]
MLLLTAVSSLLTGFLVAVGVIGRETSRLGRQRREPVWRLEEAAMFVAENLPYNAASELDPLELKELLRWHLNQLQFSESESESGSSGASVADQQGSSQDLYREARSKGYEITKPVIQEVVDGHLRYLAIIGALGIAQKD